MKMRNFFSWVFLVLAGLFIFTTESCKKKSEENPAPLTVTDTDGNIYHTVTIGTQVWMVENLRVTHYRDGTPITNITDDTQWSSTNRGAYCNFNNDGAYSEIYGLLYNWLAIAESPLLTPKGWHIPSDAEWMTLVNYLGGEAVAGCPLKESGMYHWNSPNTCASNASEFTARAGGARFADGSFGFLGEYGYWWSTTESDITDAWSRTLGYDSKAVNRDKVEKNAGFSVRCVKD